MIPIRERAQFGAAIRTKIIREIAGAEASVIPTQAHPPSSCDEGQWNRWPN